MVLISFVFYILLCLLCAWVAGEKNRNSFAWFLISFFITPVVALIALVAVPALSRDQIAERRIQRKMNDVGFYGMKY